MIKQLKPLILSLFVFILSQGARAQLDESIRNKTQASKVKVFVLNNELSQTILTSQLELQDANRRYIHNSVGVGVMGVGLAVTDIVLWKTIVKKHKILGPALILTGSLYPLELILERVDENRLITRKEPLVRNFLESESFSFVLSRYGKDFSEDLAYDLVNDEKSLKETVSLRCQLWVKEQKSHFPRAQLTECIHFVLQSLGKEVELYESFEFAIR